MLFRRGSFFLVALCIMACVHFVAAEDVHLDVAYTKWFPYTYTDGAEASGFELDTFKAVCKRMGVGVSFQELPWERCLLQLEQGKVDAVISMLPTKRRQEYAIFPDENISVSKVAFFSLKESKVVFNGDYDNLKPYRVGVVRGFSYGEEFDHVKGMKKDYSVDTSMLLRKLLAGRDSLAAGNVFVIGAKAAEMGVKDDLKFYSPPIHSSKLYVGFSKKQATREFCDRFSEELKAFKQTDNYDVILRKYNIDKKDMIDGL